MSVDNRSETALALQGAYACDLAPDGDGRAFGAWAGTDWAEEALFVARSNTAGGGWQFGWVGMSATSWRAWAPRGIAYTPASWAEITSRQLN